MRRSILSSMATFFHNPACSKSRAVAALLAEHHIEHTVVEYLKQPPERERVLLLCAQLGDPMALVRLPSDTEPPLTAEQVADAIEADPSIMQRPIVATATAARIGRPPELILELF